jgi:hypothetical protein
MNTHKISVTVDKSGIRVTPENLTMTSLDEVHWGCGTPHRFSIEFDGPSPFANVKLAHDTANQKHRPNREGRFKYTVALESDPSVRLDPIIIVDPPPSKPGP